MSVSARAPVHQVLALAATVVAVVLTADDPAQARTETLRWTHGDSGSVSGFRVHTGSATGAYGSSIDVGLPAQVGGVYSYSLNVGDTSIVYAVITAYNSSGQQSPYSNERMLTPPPPPWPVPSSDADWSEDFDALPTGGNPGGWVDTEASNSMAVNDSLFTTVRLGENVALSTSSELTNIHSHYVTSESRNWSGYEYRGRMRISHPDGGIGVTLLSQYPNADSYYRFKRQAGLGTGTMGDFYQQPHPVSRTITCARGATGVVPVPNAWYRFRFQTLPQSGRTVVRGKVWAEWQSEPAAWQIDCYDAAANRLVAGTVGIWSMGPGSKYWDDLAVFGLDATGNPVPIGPPPAPILLE